MVEQSETFLITERTLYDKIYCIRGYKVMLDVDLAQIYGYETKNFNRQVKNNYQKFADDDFMFQLTDEEVEELSRCKNCTLNRGNIRGANVKYKPYVFTEQGIYMLMTVLRGELAIKQSRALIRTFKKMKDYIIDNRALIGQREYIRLSMQTVENVKDITKLKSDISSVEKKMSDVMNQLSDVVTKSDLAEMMNSFVEGEDNGWLMYNTKYCTADLAYSEIYMQAKKSIYVGGKLHRVEYKDFCSEYPQIKIEIRRTGGIFHDRFIVLDYGTENERIFLCGASSKDAGARITSIVEDFGIKKYKPLINQLMKNQELILT